MVNPYQKAWWRSTIVLFIFLCLCLRGNLEAASSSQTSSPPLFVYLTFDDGPLKGSKEIIELIDACQVPMSMMMVGEHVKASTENLALLRQAENDPRIFIGNHSYSHAHNHYRLFYQDPQNVLKDFDKNQALLDSYRTKALPKIARLPGRNMWEIEKRSRYDISSGQSSARLLKEKGYTVIGWDLEWTHDPRTGEPIQSVDQMIQMIQRASSRAFTPGHVVVLAHDEMFRTSQEDSELKSLIQTLKEKGYSFRTLLEYPGVLPPKPEK